MTFNLVDQPWLPCTTLDGGVVELGLRDVFARADELDDLAVSAPGQRVALIRLMVAVHQSALRGPRTTDDLHALLDAGDGLDHVGRYLDRWRDRFDLFDSEHPFFQPEVDPAVAPTSVATLVADWSSGRNTTLIDHHRDDRPPDLTPAEAARALTTAQAFQLKGGRSRPFYRRAAPLAGGLVALLAGETLRDTILLNGVPYDPERGLPIPSTDDDRPCWERDADRLPHPDGTTPDGWLDLLTWLPRAVRLIPDDDGAVRRCVIHQHLALPSDIFDPHIPMRDRDGELVRVRPAEGRALWRQADSILLGLGGAASDRYGGLLSGVEELLDREYVAGIDVAAQVSSQGKIFDWSSARFPISARVAADPQLGRWIEDALALASNVARAVGRALRDGSDVLDAHWEELFWGRLRPSFEQLLRSAVAGGDQAALSGVWDQALRDAAHEAVDTALAVEVATPAAFRREAAVRRRLHIGLAHISPTEAKEVA